MQGAQSAGWTEEPSSSICRTILPSAPLSRSRTLRPRIAMLPSQASSDRVRESEGRARPKTSESACRVCGRVNASEPARWALSRRNASTFCLSVANWMSRSFSARKVVRPPISSSRTVRNAELPQQASRIPRRGRTRRRTALGRYAGIGNLAPGIFAFLIGGVTLPTLGLSGSYLAWPIFLRVGTIAYALPGRNAWYFQLRDGGMDHDRAREPAAGAYGPKLFPKRRMNESL